MHCYEVIRELAVPTDDRDLAALTEHLAACLSCAGWAKRNAQLDRLWEATRPPEPSVETWEIVWAQLASSVECLTPTGHHACLLPVASSNGSSAKGEIAVGPGRSSSRSRSWNWAAIGLIGLAQAAAIFLAVALTWDQSPMSRLPQVADNSNATSSFSVAMPTAPLGQTLSTTGLEIEEGQSIMIRVEGSTAKVFDVTPQGAAYSLEIDELYAMFNEVESLTTPKVAME